jgi:hypothetical protein
MRFRWQVYAVLVTDPDNPADPGPSTLVARCWTGTWAGIEAMHHGPDGMLLLSRRREAFGYTLADPADRDRFEAALSGRAR